MTKPIRFGVQTAPQNTTWADLAAAWKLIEDLGYETAWTFDHFFPVMAPDLSGPCFEGWIALTALAAATKRVQAGVLVTGNTYRHPAVLAKMGATLDHTSGGRLIMGLGAGWFEPEHKAYGLPFYTTAERIHQCDEAAEVIKRLWSEEKVTFDGRYYQLKDAYCAPKPLQRPHPPIMIGGAGEKLMLKVVAKHADQWNTFGSAPVFRHKISVLRDHCAAVGRNPDEIEISWTGFTLITESAAQKDEAVRRVASLFGLPAEQVEPSLFIGSLTEIRDRIHGLIAEGVTHFILMGASTETIRRFAEEVAPEFRG